MPADPNVRPDVRPHEVAPVAAHDAAAESEGDSQVELSSLLAQFYAATSTLGEFQRVASLPSPFDELLDHNHHMTVTVEAFHDDAVDVVVHRSRSVLADGRSVWHNDPQIRSEDRLAIARQTVSYSREITLVTKTDKSVVQYGIVRIDPSALQREVWLEIAGGEIPLGRVLINHDVLRSVELCRLWKVRSGVALASMLELPRECTVYGRTALIRCNGQPSIELLEIVKG